MKFRIELIDSGEFDEDDPDWACDEVWVPVPRGINIPLTYSGDTWEQSGEILRENVLSAIGLSVSEVARRIGIFRQQLHRVLACNHPITTEIALRIG